MRSVSDFDEPDVLAADVLIIGGGLAASMAAVTAAKYGVSVVLVDRGILGRSGTSPMTGGMPGAIVEDHDHPDTYYTEIIQGGYGLASPELACKLADECTERVRETATFGVPFLRNPDGSLAPMRYGKYARSIPVDGGGAALMTAMRKEVLHRRVRVVENTMVFRLFRRGDRVAGALAVDVDHENFSLFQAKAIVLATGSATKLYPHASSALLNSGDGYYLGYHAGAKLVNMEFQEFTVVPAKNGKAIPSGGLFPLVAYGARFLNAKGERFMERYAPDKLEFAPRNVLLEAFHYEHDAGRGPIVMDTSGISEENWKVWRKSQRQVRMKFRAAGIDYRSDLITYVPAIHTFLGGLKINARAETTVDGLYAAGECTGGLFGAGRGGHALSACLVYGHEAGKNAALRAMDGERAVVNRTEVLDEINKLVSLGERSTDVTTSTYQAMIRGLAWNALGIVRQGKLLEGALARIAEIEEEVQQGIQVNSSRNLVAALKLRSQLLTLKMMAISSLMRKESRGELRRQDYPQKDNNRWQKWIVFGKKGGLMSVTIEDVR